MHPVSMRNVPVQFGVEDITPIQLRGVEVVVLGQLVVTRVADSTIIKAKKGNIIIIFKMYSMDTLLFEQVEFNIEVCNHKRKQNSFCVSTISRT